MRVLHIDKNHPLLLEGLRDLGCLNETDYEGDYDAIRSKINQYEGLIVRSRIPIDKELLKRAVKLKFIGRVGAGMENIDVLFAKERGISLINAPEGNRNAVGEHCLGLLLGLMNTICKGNREVRSGIWDREGNRGVELDGNTIGIIGYGHTGKSFARKLAGFDVEVLCTDIIPGLDDSRATQVPLKELQERATVISLHVPVTELTRKMVNHSFIEAITHPFWLLNTARGECVDTNDLVQGLKSGKVLGAGLDVLEFEKASFESLAKDEDSGNMTAVRELAEAGKVLLTPHVAGWTVESKIRLAETIVKKVADQFF